MSGNNMQRVYDAMAQSREPSSAALLTHLLRMDERSVRAALTDLVARGIAYRTGPREEQRYGVVPGVPRPIDGRSQRRPDGA